MDIIIKLAPIVLFVYNRLDHTKQTVTALQNNKLADESALFIFSDGPKDDNDKARVNQVREYIQTINGFKKVTIFKKDKNYGLASSIIDGVTNIVNEYGRIIVLEDDLVTSPHFLNFMNNALEFYKEEENVYSITGYSYTDNIENIESSYFINLTNSWSWATWANKWSTFQRDKKDLESIIKSSNKEKSLFNFDDSIDYINMAKLELDDKIDSWAIYWYLSVFRKNGLTLYPQKKLVKNVGFDGSGTHCSVEHAQQELKDFDLEFTKDINEKVKNRKLVSSILKGNNDNFKTRAVNVLKKILSLKQKENLSMLLSKIKLYFYKKDIGEKTYIDKTVHVIGWSNVSIGNNCIVGENSWLNVNHKSKNFKNIEIRDNCYIGKRVTISSAKQILIKNYCLIADDCKFLGANHNYKNPLVPYAITGASDKETILIGVNVWIGNTSCVLGSVKIGHGSVIGAGSVVTKDIPPFCIAVGNPCKVIKTFDFEKNKWVRVDDQKNFFSQSIPSESEYLTQLKSNKLNVAAYKYASSKSFGDLI